MVAHTREAIMEALFTRLKTAGTVFATYSRKWVHWISDPNQERPAMPLLVQWQSPGAETYSRPIGSGMPPKRTWNVTLLLYTLIPTGDTPGVPGITAGATAINPLLDAIDTALQPDEADSGRLTLGGLVVDCGIDGEIIEAIGDIDPSGLCGVVIPLKILVQ